METAPVEAPKRGWFEFGWDMRRAGDAEWTAERVRRVIRGC